MSSRLLNLPHEIVLKILASFSQHDLKQLSKTCEKGLALAYNQSLWRAMYLYRFGEIEPRHISKDMDWRELYLSKAVLELSVSKNMVILHNYSPHWNTVVTTDSYHGSIAKLSSVCCLDVINPFVYTLLRFCFSLSLIVSFMCKGPWYPQSSSSRHIQCTMETTPDRGLAME
ncbi:hypothetical protein BDF14DRAFT_985393 [Spinellus fusiger]|nr:hypothetical protein BDF14DRAFT_985393 [Spinellus fusiger]